MRLIRTLLVMGVLTAITANANAQLVDFEDVALPPGGFTIGDPQVSRGYSFANPGNTIGAVGLEHDIDGAFNGTTHYFGGFGPSTITMTRTDGEPFNLLSLDIGEDFVAGGRTVNLVGNLDGGGTVLAALTLDGLFDGAGGIADFQTFTLNNFFNVQSVEFTHTLGASDNIVLDNLFTSVPEPNAVAIWALVGVALLGFGHARFRRP